MDASPNGLLYVGLGFCTLSRPHGNVSHTAPATSGMTAIGTRTGNKDLEPFLPFVVEADNQYERICEEICILHFCAERGLPSLACAVSSALSWSQWPSARSRTQGRQDCGRSSRSDPDHVQIRALWKAARENIQSIKCSRTSVRESPILNFGLRNSSMRNWLHCLHSARRSPSLPRNKQFFQVSRYLMQMKNVYIESSLRDGEVYIHCFPCSLRGFEHCCLCLSTLQQGRFLIN